MLKGLDIVRAFRSDHRYRIQTDCLTDSIAGVIRIYGSTCVVVLEFIVDEVDVEIRMIFHNPLNRFRQRSRSKAVGESFGKGHDIYRHGADKHNYFCHDLSLS